MMNVVVDERFDSVPAKVVWKFIVPLEHDPVSIMVPVGAKLLHAEYIAEFGRYEFQLWYECSLENLENKISHVFQVWGTGDDSIPKSAKHVHTGMTWHEDHRNRRTEPEYVWHLYEFPSGAKIKEV